MPGSKCCRHPRPPTPLMPCQGKQSKQLWLQKITAGLCFQHQINGSPLHMMVYLDPLNVKEKKKKDNPQEPEMITLKLTCACSWLCLLPLVSAHASWFLGDHWLCSLLYPTKGGTNKHHQNQRHPCPTKYWKHKILSNWYDAGTEKGIGHIFLKKTMHKNLILQKRC